MSNKVYVVPHTHWDREWYFTVEESQALLLHDLSEAMTHLENDPAFATYVLDGQSVMVTDYLKGRPEDEERLRSLAEAGRLRLGPWLTQTDSQVVAGESITRNLLYGLALARSYGDAMMVGYIPDPFGQSASLPTILNGFGIDSAVFWRGRTERHTRDVNFLWRAPDGSQVRTTHILLGYQVAKYLESDPEVLQRRMARIVERLQVGSASTNVLVPAGHDQMPIQKNLPTLLAKLEELNPGNSYRITTFEEYFDDTFADPSGMEVYEGEFTEGKYTRVHRSIYSTRMDLKLLNGEAEAELTQVLEPLLSVAARFGFEYPHGMVAEAWSLLLQTHAHDSMGGCNSDRVNEAIRHRLVKALEIIRALANLAARRLATSIAKDPNEDLLFVFNANGHPCSRTIEQELFVDAEDFALIDNDGNDVPYSVLELQSWDAQALDRQIAHLNQHIPLYRAVISFKVEFPGVGYTTLRIVPGAPGKTVPVVSQAQATRIENGGLAVELGPDGLTVTSGDGRRLAVALEESGDEGDSYNYSSPPQDLVLRDFTFSPAGVSELASTRKLSFVARRQIPASLQERAQGATSDLSEFRGVAELRDGEDFVRVHLEHDNATDDHRVRLRVGTGLHASMSIADNQFGVIRREFAHPEAENFVELGWAEKPIPVYPMMSFCALAEAARGAYVATRGLREYEAIGSDHDELAVTLFRSFGAIGKDDLVLRPGRASGIKVPSPEAQLHQHLEFDVAVGFFDGESDVAVASRAAHQLGSLERTFQVKKYNDFQLNPTGVGVPASFDWFTLDASVVLSAVKQAESGSGYVVRFFNPTWEPVEVAVPSLEGLRPHYSRLDETEGEGVADASVTVPPCGVTTLLYRV